MKDKGVFAAGRCHRHRHHHHHRHQQHTSHITRYMYARTPKLVQSLMHFKSDGSRRRRRLFHRHISNRSAPLTFRA